MKMLTVATVLRNGRMEHILDWFKNHNVPVDGIRYGATKSPLALWIWGFDSLLMGLYGG
jgi:hypothetical protein